MTKKRHAPTWQPPAMLDDELIEMEAAVIIARLAVLILLAGLAFSLTGYAKPTGGVSCNFQRVQMNAFVRRSITGDMPTRPSQSLVTGKRAWSGTASLC